MKILVLNCGSSSIKFQLINMEDERVITSGLFERIGTEESVLTVKWDGKKEKLEKVALNHAEGIKIVLETIVDPKYNIISSMEEITAVGHRVVHGGEKFVKSQLITKEVEDGIREYISLAPLHNHANLQGIEAAKAVLPNVPQIAVFDTAFHQTMPEKAYIYNIPYRYYEENRIRKYGFHGTSHRYISKRVYELLGKNEGDDLKLISCHLGQGASLAAIKNGKSIDTTMGLTALSGIPMGTRSGDIDPSVVLHLGKTLDLSYDDLNNILNKESGAYGLSGVSADFRDIEAAALEDNKRAILALESNAYNVAKAIASYIAVLGGVDVIAFAGGLGENGIETRERVCKYLEAFGIKLDLNENNIKGEEKVISKEDSSALIYIVPTNEELMIARDTKEIVENM